VPCKAARLARRLSLLGMSYIVEVDHEDGQCTSSNQNFSKLLSRAERNHAIEVMHKGYPGARPCELSRAMKRTSDDGQLSYQHPRLRHPFGSPRKTHRARDLLSPDDIFVLEPARATSLYHIVGAVAQLSAAIPDSGSATAVSRLWAPRTMLVSTRDWLSVQMMAVFERDFPPGWLPFVHLTPLS
jgi:hypothetical protein